MQVKDQLVFRIATVLGFLTVLLGSLGAHAIKFESEKLKELFDIALLYQAIHVPVLLFLCLFQQRRQAMVMAGGLVGFCWSLFFKSITGGNDILGPLVPTGGMLLLFAWIWLLFTVNTDKNSQLG